MLIAPAGATLEEVPRSIERIPEPAQPVNPRIDDVDISRVYYESSAYSTGRYYVTAIGEEPGFVAQTSDVQRAGDPMQVGK